MNKEIHVNSFDTDHTTMQAGLYLRELRKIVPLVHIKIWDLRFVAPMLKQPLTPGASHVIEHIFAYKLREKLGNGYIAFCTYGCLTGFFFESKDWVDKEQLVNAILETIDEVCPLTSLEQVPAMNEKQCGSPFINDIKGANEAMNSYYKTLITYANQES